MQRIGLWHVTPEGPSRLASSGVGLEKYLENWIEKDPSLVQAGLTIVGRQIAIEGGRLDLLALDPQGQWVVIEIKAGAVDQWTIAQGLVYAAAIATMPFEQLSQKVDAYLKISTGSSLKALLTERQAIESDDSNVRDVQVFVVGTARSYGWERMIGFLSRKADIEITLVTYQVFEIAGGHKILVRELDEVEISTPQGSSSPARTGRTLDELRTEAQSSGVGQPFEALLAAAQRHGLNPQPKKWSVVYTPPRMRSRTLLYVGAYPDKQGRVQIWVGPSAFAEFYPVTVDKAAEILGTEGSYSLSLAEAENYASRLDLLFESMDQPDEVSP